VSGIQMLAQLALLAVVPGTGPVRRRGCAGALGVSALRPELENQLEGWFKIKSEV